MPDIPQIRTQGEQFDAKFGELVDKLNSIDRKLLRHDIITGVIGSGFLILAAAFGVAYMTTWQEIASNSKDIGTVLSSVESLKTTATEFKQLVADSKRELTSVADAVDQKLHASAAELTTAKVSIQDATTTLDELKKLPPRVDALNSNVGAAKDAVDSIAAKMATHEQKLTEYAAAVGRLTKILDPEIAVSLSCRVPLKEELRIQNGMENAIQFSYETTGGLLSEAIGSSKFFVRQVTIDIVSQNGDDRGGFRVISRGEIRSDATLIVTVWTDDLKRFNSLMSAGSLVAVVQVALPGP